MPIINLIYNAPKEITKVFDFQNDGDLGWQSYGDGHGDCSIVSGQGWQITRSGYNVMYCYIVPPAEIYNGTLKKYKIYFYKPSGSVAFGIANKGAEISGIEYGRDGSKLYVNSTQYNAINRTGECTLEATFGEDGILTVVISDGTNTDTYTFSNVVSVFNNYWNNKTLVLYMGRWNSNNVGYIRKVEITTEN